jgi:hypothetical protein
MGGSGGRINDFVDEYTYARKHSDGPGAWQVIGPNGFAMSVPGLDKCAAYAIGKILNGDFDDAIRMLQSIRVPAKQPRPSVQP